MRKIQKNIYFSEEQVKLMEIRALSFGMSVNEWIKYLVNKDLEENSRKIETKLNKQPEKGSELDELVKNRKYNLSMQEMIEQRDKENELIFKESKKSD